MENKAALAAIAEVNTMFEDKSLVVTLGNTKGIEIKRTSSSRLSIDSVMGGGAPDGKIIEIYGLESSGKTTIALHILSAYQNKHKDKMAAFIDFEHAFDPKYAKSLGINTKHLAFSQPTYAEQGLEAIDTLISSGGFSAVVVDSVAAMTPKSELEGEMGKASIGRQALLMSQAMRKLTGTANKTKTTLIFINQMREKIGIMFGNPWVTAGGNALKFYASVRLEVRRGTKVKDKEGNIILNRGKVIAVKNKTFPPYREAEFDIEFGTGISRESDIIDFAVEQGLIIKSGAWFTYNDTKLGQGKQKAKELLKDNPDLSEEIETLIYKQLFE